MQCLVRILTVSQIVTLLCVVEMSYAQSSGEPVRGGAEDKPNQVQPPVTQQARNLILNPSLEEPTPKGRLPRGWSIWPAGDTTYRREVVEGGRTGKKCLRISGDGDHGVVFVAGVKLDRNKRYALKGWVKIDAESDARAQIKLNYFHNHKHLGLTETVSVTPDQKGWQPFERTDRADEVAEASWIWVSCVLWGKGTAWFDDLELVAYDRDKVDSNFDTKHGRSNFPPEFHVLQRRIGTWTTQMTIKPGKRFPTGLKSQGEKTVSWSLDKKVIIDRGVSQSGKSKSMTIETYDPQHKVFRSWYFDSHGSQPRTPSTGTWDESTQTLTFRTTDLDGGGSIVHVRFIGNDEVRWNGVWKDKDGKTVMEIDNKSTRK